MSFENRWVYRLSDTLFLRGGFSDPVFDQATEGVVVLPDERFPDPVRERCDPAAPSRRRPATAQEIAAIEDARKDADIDQQKALRALAQATFELKTTDWTAQQFRDRIKAIYRSL